MKTVRKKFPLEFKQKAVEQVKNGRISAELLIPLPAEWGVFLEKGCKVTDIDSRQSLGHQPPR
ncbi:hypothetical protein [Pasteuria penetrans]|uniref:hypothetical protein n=1 Tax=Pasteuria penetrans TaxID=86005 RepID=UPI000FC3BE23|nr:hypothetical protein [Pasteuria penetrans]